MSKPHPSIIEQAERLAAEHPEAVITLINARGQFLYVSPSSTEITGYTPEEALGKRFVDFLLPEDTASLHMDAQNVLLGERSPDTYMRAKAKAGGTFLMRGHAVKVLDPKTGDSYLLSQAYRV